MFYVLLILGILVGFIALVFIIGLFSKKGYEVHRSIVIKKPVDEVFNYIKHIKNQDFFSKWVMTDPGMKRVFTGNDGEEGFVYAWDSVNKQAGKGEQEITKIDENKRLDVEVRFEKPFKAVAKTPFTTESLGEKETKVTWFMESKMNYPMNLMLLFMNFDKMLGKDMEISLNNLKVILEEK